MNLIVIRFKSQRGIDYKGGNKMLGRYTYQPLNLYLKQIQTEPLLFGQYPDC